MVPQPESVAQRRYRELASQNASSSLTFQQPTERPSSKGLITYGKSKRPLSLTGNQFLRRDPYDIPSDSEREDDGAGAQSQSAARQTTDSSDSPLSDAEPSAQDEPFRATASSRVPNKFNILEAASASTRLSDVPSTAQVKKGTAKAVRRPRPRPLYDPEPVLQSNNISMTKKLAKRTVSSREVVASERRRKIQAPMRRLPVNELMLVASAALQCDHTFKPVSSAPVVLTQDPIQDLSSQLRQQSISSVESGSAGEKQAPKKSLTTIRKRLHTPKFRHKALKRQKVEQPSLWGASSTKVTIGDGFDESELHIDYRLITHKKHSRRKAPTKLSYNVLQLSSGPLPDVVFDSSTDELQLEPSGGPHHISSQQRSTDRGIAAALRKTQPSQGALEESADELQTQSGNGDHLITSQRHRKGPKEHSGELAKRRVSFSDREELILAQLSSVSAPARPESDSEADDEDEDEDEEEVETEVDEENVSEQHQQVGLNASDSDMDDTLQDHDPTAIASAPDSSEYADMTPHLRHHSRVVPDDPILDELDDSSILDIGKPATPGTRPRRQLGRPSLMEVDEPIIDVLEAEIVHVPRSEPFAAPVEEQIEIVNTTTHRPHHRRPRSILKSSTPLVPESTYNRADTVANTRRNSRRHTMDEVEDSRSLSQATHTLSAPDPARHKIMPRRSSYFDDSFVQVADSKTAVLETSPEPPDFTNATQLNVLRRSSESVWTSQSLPAKAGDLRQLTRNVSRENGTLSQSVRRRPSLPFQSPTKAR